MFLLDTNVLSETRVGRAKPVIAWLAAQDESDLYISVLSLGELRRGVESLRRRDAVTARHLDRWLAGLVVTYRDRTLPVDGAVAEIWGRLNVPSALPAIDSLLAATAVLHDLTVVTRNERAFVRTGVATLNPFTSG
ncbi:MAG TPA: type II toxin-antitoxin system VapC family toxin [Kofleriaceae bacterium]|jgi:hypothetical protein